MSAGHDTEKSLKKIEMNVAVSFNMNHIREFSVTVILKSLGMYRNPFLSTSSKISLISF